MSELKSPLQARPRESESVQVMQVLDLLLDVAYHDGTTRELAVAAEAWTLAGFHDGSIMVSHTPAWEPQAAVAQARKGRPKQLLRHDAQGLLYGVRTLIREGLIEGREASNRTNERWKERGGYDRST